MAKFEDFYHYGIETKIIEDFKKLVDTNVSNGNGIVMRDNSRWDYSTSNALQFDINPYDNDLEPLTSFCKEKIEKISGKKVYLNSIWTIYGAEHAYHKCHDHMDENMSERNNFASVLYLEVPQNPVNPDAGALYYFMDGELDHFHPIAGDLVWFPVSTFHGTYPQEAGLRHTLNMDWIVDN
tara:strand:+ start:63 stop:605 length:543 start_codon:yes stop_codon:yes gene_type:complete